MTWVSDGQKVYVPWKGTWLLCTVTTAMGDTARCTNPLYGIDDWFPVYDLSESPVTESNRDIQ